jgi:NADH:ubiquinone reductase (H+-translocating)
MNNITKQIVLVGGGYASIWAYRSIVHELLIEMMAGLVKIKVICPDDFHIFHGWTAESLTGIIGDQNRLSKLSEVFKYAELVKGKVVQIDDHSNIIYVDMNNGSRITILYDQILFGTGSTDSNSVEGLAKYAFCLKAENAYQNTKIQIQNLIRRSAETDCLRAQKILRFVIAGSGYTGVEIASNLAELIHAAKRQYPALIKVNPSIYLVNSKDDLLPGLQSGLRRMRNYSEKTLRKYGIEMLKRVKIIRVTERGAYLSDGSFIECEMVISTIGQSRIVLAGTEKMERDSEKRIITNSFLQVKNHPGIWGAGDSVHITHCKTKNPCPSNALWAIKQGEHAGKNMARAFLNQPLKPFNYKGLGQCASLGIGKGIGELYGIQFTGWLAWIIRWFFFQHYMPSKKVMWREITDWLYLFVSGKRKYFDMSHIKTRGDVIEMAHILRRFKSTATQL